MKEIVHQGLSDLVIQMGTIRINPQEANCIVNASIKPDILNKQEIKENILNAPKILINWWKDHSLLAKNSAISYAKVAKKAFRNNQFCWTEYLGYSFHFITDWATPYHSPNKVVLMINSIKDQSEEHAKSLKGLPKKNQISLQLFNVGFKLLSKAIALKMDHDEFEIQCEQKWIPFKNIISEIFRNLKNFNSIMINIDLIEKRLDNLQEKYKDISLNWINSNNNYAKYMAEIAFVMDLVYEFVLKI